MSEKTFFELRNIETLENLERIREDLPKFCDEFFIGIQNRTSVLTRLNYAYDLRIFFDFLTKKIFKNKDVKDYNIDDIQKLTAYDIEKFLDYLNNYEYKNQKSQCGEKAKERKLSTIRSFIKYFFKKDKLDKNVAAKAESPKIHTKDILRLDVHEIVRVLNCVEFGTTSMSTHQQKYQKNTKVRDLAILTLFLGTGIRISELVGLDINDIDLENDAFVITRKGGNTSILYFSQEVHDALREYIKERDVYLKKAKEKQDNNALFLSLQGSRLGVRAIQNLVLKYTSIATPLKHITPHKLRSTYGTALYRETGDIYTVAEVLGHKDVNTTKKHYAESSQEIRRAASKKVILREKNN